MATTLRLVKIDWLDAVASTGWQSDSVEPTVNTSVGYVVYETEEYTQLAGTIDSQSSYYNNSITIPAGMILEVKDLHETKQRKSKGTQPTKLCSEKDIGILSSVDSIGCKKHFNGGNWNGCSNVVDGNCSISNADRVQKSCSNCDLQGLPASNFSRDPRAIASD